MIWGVIDPKVFLLSDSSNPDDLERSVLALVHWQDLISEKLPKAYNTVGGPECLAKLRGFPLWAHLGERLRSSGSQVDIHDVIDVFNGLMKLPAIEDELGIREFICSGMDIVPKSYWNNEPLLNEQFERICALLLLLKWSKNLSNTQLLVLTKELDFPPCHFSVRCTFELFEMINGASTAPQCKELSGVCTGINSYAEFANSCDADTVWQNATSVDDLKLAIRIALPTDSRDLPWSLGSRFLEAIQSQHLQTPTHSSPIIRACIEVILKLNLRDTHVLRVGSGPKDEQKKRGPDTAWRRDINRDMHLHYWETLSGPELAWVTVTHHEMFIPD